MLLEPVMGLRSFLVSFRALQSLGLLVLGACAASKNRYLHAGAIVVIVLVLVAGLTLAGTPFHQFELR